MSTARTWSILVPLDGSKIAEQALWIAARLAHRLRAALHLVTVRAPASAAGDEAKDSAERAAIEHEIRHDLHEYLQAKADELRTAHGVACVCAVIDGWPAAALVEYVRANRMALVVLTAHGQSGVSRCWIGSVTDGLLARISAPVLVVRPGITPQRARFDRILVALDGSAGSGKVLREAVSLGALDQGTEYTLVEIVEPSRPVPRQPAVRGGPDPAGSLARRRKAAERDLEQRAERLRKRGVAVATRAIIAEGVGGHLIELADSLGIELIVVGDHSPRATEGLLLGSVADKAVRGASQPVLVVPVRAPRARAPRASGRRRATIRRKEARSP